MLSSGASALKRGGKTFWFASLFLPKSVAADAADIYAFCRSMDDLADDGAQSDAVRLLRTVDADLEAGRSSDPVVARFLEIATAHRLDLSVARHFLEAITQDAAGEVAIQDEAELIRYCYGVAGTVGLTMAGILGADPQRSYRYAIELGIAMQMTNIARDVMEDARHGRRYLPACWVGNLTASEIAKGGCRDVVASAVARLLELADGYYGSAALGFHWIPKPCRRSIRIAAAVYREIGVVIRHRNFDWWRTRAYVRFPSKIRIAVGACLGTTTLERLPFAADIRDLRRILAGMPGIP